MPKRDILHINDLSNGETLALFNRAKQCKALLHGKKFTNTCKGKTVVTLFYENSTRTRVSFELAAKYLGAETVAVSAAASSVAKGESLQDTGRTLDRMGTNVMVLRHPQSGSPALLAGAVKASVINAGDGMHEHPTQALLDMFTLQDKLGNLQGLKVAIIGDIRHSRVARSNIMGLTRMGANVFLAGPNTLLPVGIEELGGKITTLEKALEGANAVMALRIQLERQKAGLFPSLREYAALYGLNSQRMEKAAKNALVLHPGPINRGVELTGEVADCPQSVIEEQVENGVAVRMALLELLTSGQ